MIHYSCFCSKRKSKREKEYFFSNGVKDIKLPMSALIQREIEESYESKKKLLTLSSDIEKAGLMAAETLKAGGKLLLCGNGGSAADAQHIVAELVVRYKTKNERRGLPAISLALDSSTVTACGNDYGYEFIYSRALEAIGNEGDLLIAISTSGNSQNVINAVKKAKEKKIKTLLLLGNTGGKLKGTGDFEVLVQEKYTARIQECHILIGHIICSVIEKELFNLD